MDRSALAVLNCTLVSPPEITRVVHPGGDASLRLAAEDAGRSSMLRRRADAALRRSLFARRVTTAPTVVIPVLVAVGHFLAWAF